MANIPIPPLEDVLDAFSVEPDLGKETLQHYLQDYPQYAEEIVDLSFELSKPINRDGAPWTVDELAEIEGAWQKHGKSMFQIANPFEGLAVDKLRQIAQDLGVPRIVLSAFRERQVAIASVPKKFLGKLAAALGQTIESYMAFAQSTSPSLAGRSFKSKKKPQVAEQITFTQMLIDAQVPEEKRQKLLAED